MMKEIWVKNVVLETGYIFDEQQTVTGTETGEFHLCLANGKIKEIITAGSKIENGAEVFDANHTLALPAFAEMHIHLDKTYYGGKWKAPILAENIFSRIEEEQTLLLEQLPYVRERAEKISSSG